MILGTERKIILPGCQHPAPAYIYIAAMEAVQ